MDDPDAEVILVATQVGIAGAAASFAAAVFERDGSCLVIAADDIDVPASGWELRASGLWADHICESPLEHWSYGLEAFALSIDDPAELLGSGLGHRRPLGWELEFEAREPAVELGSQSYHQAGRAHGLVLFAGRTVEIDGTALRSHGWDNGRFDDSSLDDGSPLLAEVALPAAGMVWWVGPTADGGARSWLGCSRAG